MRKWILLSLLFPLVAWLLYKVADEVQAKRGETGLTRLLRTPYRWRHRRAA